MTLAQSQNLNERQTGLASHSPRVFLSCPAPPGTDEAIDNWKLLQINVETIDKAVEGDHLDRKPNSPKTPVD